ncbi:hypothetical protein Ddye_002544 [Dipteronia dyeriana]|uniref:DUF1308 domain-containing protein n=1 Tax=Dipteronia dyeriana TaxID=168575 RepID=A0AAE0CUH2_9ROSI|nr:hypothetical protein Ddye_002544 [Dipteronia dyeriana]
MEDVEVGKKRCKGVIERIGRLPPSTNISDSSKQSLLKLASSELNFLSRFSPSNPIQLPLSTNIGHLEALLHILHQPFVSGVSRLCKPIRIAQKSVHVDIVCTLKKNPVWIIVSARNPDYISWNTCHKSKGLRFRVEQVLDAACSSGTLKPFSVILFFANGLSSLVFDRLRNEFGATEFSMFEFDFCEEIEDGWMNVPPRSFREACVVEIKLNFSGNGVSSSECGVKDSVIDAMGSDIPEEHAFGSFVSKMNLCSMMGGEEVESAEPDSLPSGGGDLINFDTTALIAVVSGISNGCADKLLASPEFKLRQRFKGNVQFVIAQAMAEIQNPIHEELSGVIAGKKGIICESVLSEFKELVAMCGGSNEKLRAAQLLKHLTVVHNSPSDRMMGLPTTRKLALKNKVVFGTGDRWHAPTLTANTAFVRAVSQTGMSLPTIEHRPRALTGDLPYIFEEERFQ